MLSTSWLSFKPLDFTRNKQRGKKKAHRKEAKDFVPPVQFCYFLERVTQLSTISLNEGSQGFERLDRINRAAPVNSRSDVVRSSNNPPRLSSLLFKLLLYSCYVHPQCFARGLRILSSLYYTYITSIWLFSGFFSYTNTHMCVAINGKKETRRKNCRFRFPFDRLAGYDQRVFFLTCVLAEKNTRFNPLSKCSFISQSACIETNNHIATNAAQQLANKEK